MKKVTQYSEVYKRKDNI